MKSTRVGARYCCLKKHKCCWERNASMAVPLALILDRAHIHWGLNDSSDHSITLDVTDGASMIGRGHRLGLRVEVVICDLRESEPEFREGQNLKYSDRIRL